MHAHPSASWGRASDDSVIVLLPPIDIHEHAMGVVLPVVAQPIWHAKDGVFCWAFFAILHPLLLDVVDGISQTAIVVGLPPGSMVLLQLDSCIVPWSVQQFAIFVMVNLPHKIQ